MLITVKTPKLVLGRTVYLRGDVFECRDAEAKLLVASGIATKSSPGSKATKGAPTAPTTGMSIKRGTPKASPETPAPSVGRAKRVAPSPSAQSAAPTPTPAPASIPAAKPIGAMTMHQPGNVPKV